MLDGTWFGVHGLFHGAGDISVGGLAIIRTLKTHRGGVEMCAESMVSRPGMPGARDATTLQ